MPMDKNSTPSPTSILQSGRKQPATVSTPSAATLARIRQFARSYVYFRQAGSIGGVILN